MKKADQDRKAIERARRTFKNKQQCIDPLKQMRDQLEAVGKFDPRVNLSAVLKRSEELKQNAETP